MGILRRLLRYMLLAVSIIGEYVGKIFEETKGRPKFIRRSVIYRRKVIKDAGEMEGLRNGGKV